MKFIFVFPKYTRINSLLWLFCCIFLIAACNAEQKNFSSKPTDTEKAEEFVAHLTPSKQNMRTWNELRPTLQKSLQYVKAKKQDAFAIRRKGLRLTWGQMHQSLSELLQILPKLDANPKLLLTHFRWIKISEGIKYTGYYEPLLIASRHYKKGYHPLYKRPPELSYYRKNRKKYYSREIIDTKKVLAKRGLELAWAKSLVDIYYLQIQGSGKLLYEDGTFDYVNYAGQNGHKYTISGKTMKDMGLITKGDVLEQRKWFLENPTRISEILNTNPSYVFFRLGKGGARGAMGRVLTPLASLASDRRFIPLGAVVAYGLEMPHILLGKAPMRGLASTQDVGGAIKGNRCDIFMGGGPIAEYSASLLHNHGIAWVLISKKALQKKPTKKKIVLPTKSNKT